MGKMVFILSRPPGTHTGVTTASSNGLVPSQLQPITKTSAHWHLLRTIRIKNQLESIIFSEEINFFKQYQN